MLHLALGVFTSNHLRPSASRIFCTVISSVAGRYSLTEYKRCRLKTEPALSHFAEFGGLQTVCK